MDNKLLSKNAETEYFKNTFSSTLDFFIEAFGVSPIYEEKTMGDQSLLVIRLKNKKFLKQIEFQYSQGIDIDGKPYDFFNFYVKYTGVLQNKTAVTRDSFFLDDYCAYKEIAFDIPYSGDIETRIKEYFNFLKTVFLENGLKDLLLEKEWTSIPIDYSPYK